MIRLPGYWTKTTPTMPPSGGMTLATQNPVRCLIPLTGTCELYESRPVICRTFGPALKTDGDLGHCELCFVGATEEEVIASEMNPDPESLEAALLDELQKSTGASGETIIAFALVR